MAIITFTNVRNLKVNTLIANHAIPRGNQMVDHVLSRECRYRVSKLNSINGAVKRRIQVYKHKKIMV